MSNGYNGGILESSQLLYKISSDIAGQTVKCYDSSKDTDDNTLLEKMRYLESENCIISENIRKIWK